jgi:mono/diheme cytochrome c family protein
MRKRTRHILACGALLAGFTLNPLALDAAEPQGDAKALQAVQQQWGLLDEYCTSCHNLEDWAGSVAFDTLSPENIPADAAIWEAAMRKLRGRLMPPPGNDRPAEAAIDAFVASMESHLDAVAAAEGVNPGHIAVHRLNRKEYANAIADILAVQVDAEQLLPPDTSSDGFDNVAEVLQVSPSFLEQYLSAARSVSILAVGEAAPAPDIASFEAPSLANQYRHVDGLPLGTRGGFAVEHYFPADGEYEFNVDIASQEGSLQRSYPTWWLQSEHRFILTIDGEEVYTTTLGGPADEEAVDRIQTPAITEIQNRFMNIRLPVKAGHHQLAAGFVARTYAESDRIVDHLSPGEGQDNIPVVVSFKAFGPLNPAGLPDVPSRSKIFSCYPASAEQQEPCARQIMATLVRQAFRRPVTAADMVPLMQFYQSGVEQGGFETGIQKAIMAMLGSTKFLYRAEPLPEGAQPGESFPVSDVELASRLSFFLWSSGPDEELLSLAERNQLHEPQVLKAQVSRMLAHPRAAALTHNFAFQWLHIEDIDAIDPDPRIFPEFDKDLRAAFKEELALFVDSILRAERSVLELLSAQHSFLNERLARHYGIDSVRGSQFRKVSLEDQRRWGLLGKGGVLLLTSYPNRTSPVLRGAYILETLIGTPPAAPPPGVEIDLDSREPGEAVTTVRQRLEAHREQPSCNQCHGVIDPMGLALENFDAIGLWRDIDRYAAAPIDAQGRLVSGQPLTGPADLRDALLARPDQFVWALTEKLMTFALGRSVQYYDMPIVRSVARRAAANDYRFEEIVLGIVESDAFRMKSVPVEEESTGTGALSHNE